MNLDINELKKRINKLDPSKWKLYVKIHNEYEMVPYMDKEKRISRSFYKLIEIVHYLKNHKYIVPNDVKNVMCLCEAPGGFYEACCLLFPNADVKMQSKMDTNIKLSSKVLFKNVILESNGKGDIFNIHTQKHLKLILGKNSCDLITADGGIDCSHDYDHQEKINFPLIRKELELSFYILKENGILILKLYDTLLDETIHIIKSHAVKFKKKIVFIKPLMSRPCNSEKYALFIPASNNKIGTIENISPNCEKLQLKSMREVYELCINEDISKINGYKEKQIKKSQEFLKKYNFRTHRTHRNTINNTIDN